MALQSHSHLTKTFALNNIESWGVVFPDHTTVNAIMSDNMDFEFVDEPKVPPPRTNPTDLSSPLYNAPYLPTRFEEFVKKEQILYLNDDQAITRNGSCLIPPLNTPASVKCKLPEPVIYESLAPNSQPSTIFENPAVAIPRSTTPTHKPLQDNDYVIDFNERITRHRHPIFRLIAALGYGAQGVVYLVKNMLSNELHVRKEFSDGRGEVPWYNILPKKCVPRLIERYRSPVSAPHEDLLTTTYQFANGGDMHRIIQIYMEGDRRMPDILVWHVLADVMDILDRIHFGMGRKKVITHNDIHSGNVFLHWTRDRVLPSVMLGDWGNSCMRDFSAAGDLRIASLQLKQRILKRGIGSQLFNDPKRARGNAIDETVKHDLKHIQFLIGELLKSGINARTTSVPEHPIAKWWGDLRKELSTKRNDLSKPWFRETPILARAVRAQYNFVLRNTSPKDLALLRKLKPEYPTVPLVFSGATEMERDAKLARWVKEKNNKRGLQTGGWQWTSAKNLASFDVRGLEIAELEEIMMEDEVVEEHSDSDEDIELVDYPSKRRLVKARSALGTKPVGVSKREVRSKFTKRVNRYAMGGLSRKLAL